MFRAIGDQFEGHCRNHYRFRFEIANFMSEHREEFEPFIEDDIPFDRYSKYNMNTIKSTTTDVICLKWILNMAKSCVNQTLN